MSKQRVLHDLAAAAGIVGLAAGFAAWGRVKSLPPAPSTKEVRLVGGPRTPHSPVDSIVSEEFTFLCKGDSHAKAYKGFLETPMPNYPGSPACSEKDLVDHP